jgi:hypothetical protein
MAREITAGRIKAARIIAVVADILQLALMPVTVEGAFSPIEDGLDILVAGIMVYLVGLHWAFVPSFAAKLVPVVDMVPTWTLAVLVATRNGPTGPDGEALSSTTAPGTAPGSGPEPGKVTDVEPTKAE